MSFSNDGEMPPVMVAFDRTGTGEPLLAISGEVDGDPHDLITHSITDAADGAVTVHLDLTGVDFMGSAGLALLVRAAQALEADGKRIQVDASSHIVRRLLEATLLAEYFGLLGADPPARRVPQNQARHHSTEPSALMKEIANLQAALESRPVIDLAKGILIAHLGCEPERAFQLLVAQSQAENRKVRDVAEELVARNVRQREPPSTTPR